MQEAKTLKGYRKEVDKALANDFLRQAMDNFAVAYRTSRANAFAGLDVDSLVAAVAEAKDQALDGLDELYAQFKTRAEARASVRVEATPPIEAVDEILLTVPGKGKVTMLRFAAGSGFGRAAPCAHADRRREGGRHDRDACRQAG